MKMKTNETNITSCRITIILLVVALFKFATSVSAQSGKITANQTHVRVATGETVTLAIRR